MQRSRVYVNGSKKRCGGKFPIEIDKMMEMMERMGSAL